MMAQMQTRLQLRVRPRAWQLEAAEIWKHNDRRGIVEVVTGAGKTLLAEICLLDFLAQEPDGQILVLVPTLALVDQWCVSLQEDLGAQKSDIATYSGEGSPKQPSLLNVMTLNTARDSAARVAANRPTLLIADECHHAASRENAKALAPRYRASLGLSATPQRAYDSGFEDVLVPALGELIYRYDYARARAEEVVSAFELTNVAVDLLPAERKRYDELTQRIAREMRKSTRDEARLESLLRVRARVAANARMRIPAAVRLAEERPSARTIIFHESVSAANAIAGSLARRGHSVALYHSHLGPELRRENLRLFRTGVFEIIVCCRALDEGVNVPQATRGVIASSTATVRQRIQRMGRLLRPAPGKTLAQVYTVYATEIEERRLSEDAVAAAAERVRWKRVSVRDDV